MRNLIKAVKDNLGLRRGKLLFGFEGRLLVDKTIDCN